MNQEKKDKSFNRKMGERYKKASTEEKKQGSNKYMKRYSTLLVTRDMFISTAGKGPGNEPFSNMVVHGGV